MTDDRRRLIEAFEKGIQEARQESDRIDERVRESNVRVEPARKVLRRAGYLRGS